MYQNKIISNYILITQIFTSNRIKISIKIILLSFYCHLLQTQKNHILIVYFDPWFYALKSIMKLKVIISKVNYLGVVILYLRFLMSTLLPILQLLKACIIKP